MILILFQEIKNVLLNILKITLTKVIIKCERNHILSFLMNDEKNDKFLKKFFDNYFESSLELGDEKIN